MQNVMSKMEALELLSAANVYNIIETPSQIEIDGHIAIRFGEDDYALTVTYDGQSYHAEYKDKHACSQYAKKIIRWFQEVKLKDTMLLKPRVSEVTEMYDPKELEALAETMKAPIENPATLEEKKSIVSELFINEGKWTNSPIFNELVHKAAEYTKSDMTFNEGDMSDLDKLVLVAQKYDYKQKARVLRSAGLL